VLAQQHASAAAAGIPFSEVKVTGLMSDGIHFNRAGYGQWLPVLMDAVQMACAAAPTN
jgi:lysophospholipase L1-like esterase